MTDQGAPLRGRAALIGERDLAIQDILLFFLGFFAFLLGLLVCRAGGRRKGDSDVAYT